MPEDELLQPMLAAQLPAPSFPQQKKLPNIQEHDDSTEAMEEERKKGKNADKENAAKTMNLAKLFWAFKVSLDRQIEDLQEFDDVLEEVEHARMNLAKVLGGCQMIWKIDDFHRKFTDAQNGEVTTIFSPSFETHSHGYNMALSLCPNGDGKGKEEYMSIFFCILKGRWDPLLPWPFRCPITFTILEQSDRDTVIDVSAKFTPNPARENTGFLGRPTKARNPSLGLPQFISHALLLGQGGAQFVKDDTIFIKVELDTSSVIRP